MEMEYEKQNFEDGQTLKAEHLNHIEDGIAKLIDAMNIQFAYDDGYATIYNLTALRGMTWREYINTVNPQMNCTEPHGDEEIENIPLFAIVNDCKIAGAADAICAIDRYNNYNDSFVCTEEGHVAADSVIVAGITYISDNP